MVELLRAAGVELLVDVRTAPGSRRHPHVARSEMSVWLPEHGIAYRHEPRLGGWRRARPDSPDTSLRNRSFAGYAAHMRTPEFRAAVDDLLADAARTTTTVMCAESLWWRCHRRMLADHVVAVCDVPVVHLLHDGDRQRHTVSDLARRDGDGLVYDGGQQDLFGRPGEG
ncbi:MAG TPA: DUF488 domain-containing protein [Streptosporangiales bacterium]